MGEEAAAKILAAMRASAKAAWNLAKANQAATAGAATAAAPGWAKSVDAAAAGPCQSY